jgi:hypothetical protein
MTSTPVSPASPDVDARPGGWAMFAGIILMPERQGGR